MSEQPFMQLYVADYLGDTRHLTTEQHGAYLLLLMTMWRHGGKLPNDASKLARIAGVSARRWHLVASDVLPLFTVEGDFISQKRLAEEYRKAASKSEKRSACGKLGGNAKALKEKETNLAKARDLLKHSSEVREQRLEVSTSNHTEPNGSRVAEPKSQPSADTPNCGDGDGSDEDRFWALAEVVAPKGIPRSMCGKLANLLGGAFDEGCAILRDASKARSARPYLAKIIKRRQDEAAPRYARPDPAVPDWVTDARMQGYPVTKEGKRWRMAGGLYDDEGELWGN